MSVIRDRNHEGWVLAAYPDPNTGRPLIGTGYSLEVAATDHPQYDPLNPNQFLSPGRPSCGRRRGWTRNGCLGASKVRPQHGSMGDEGLPPQVRAHTLRPQLTEEEAIRLLRISAIQAVINAKAYCRDFDQLSGPAQMAFGQLVFRMGVNLEDFVESSANSTAMLGTRPFPAGWRRRDRRRPLEICAKHAHRQPMGEALYDSRRHRHRYVQSKLFRAIRRPPKRAWRRSFDLRRDAATHAHRLITLRRAAAKHSDAFHSLIPQWEKLTGLSQPRPQAQPIPGS